MRPPLLALVIASFLVPAGAPLPGDPFDAVGTRTELVAPTNGTFVAGLLGVGLGDPDPTGIVLGPGENVSYARWETVPPGCDRHIHVDLQFTPNNLTNGSAPVDVVYTLRLRVHQESSMHDAEIVLSAPVRALYVTTVPDDAPILVSLVLETGLDVDWRFRAEGRQDFQAAGCAPEPL